MQEQTLSQRVRGYLDRVVNQHDLAEVGRLVLPGYRGSGFGWPADRESLMDFYRWQARSRPTWRIDVQSTLGVGDVVVVHAHAGGTVLAADPDRPEAAPTASAVEWLAAYRFAEDLIVQIQVLQVRDRSAS